MSRFHEQLAAGLARLRSRDGVTVTVARGGDSVEVTAVVGQSDHETLDDTGMPVTIQSRDFMLAAADYAPAGSAVVPLKGDRITEGTRVYAVRDIGSAACWAYSDQGRTTIRVHTSEVSS